MRRALEALPALVRRDWVAPDRARRQVWPECSIPSATTKVQTTSLSFGTGRHKLVPAVVHFQSRSGGFRTIHQLGAPFVIFSTNIVVVSHVRTNLVESVHGAFPLESMEICSESMAVTGIDAALRTPNPRGILPLVYQQLFSRTEHHVSVCVSACV